MGGGGGDDQCNDTAKPPTSKDEGNGAWRRHG